MTPMYGDIMGMSGTWVSRLLTFVTYLLWLYGLGEGIIGNLDFDLASFLLVHPYYYRWPI